TVGDGFLSLAGSPDADGNDTWTLDVTGTTLSADTYPVVATLPSLAGNTASANQDDIVESAASTAGAAPAVTLSEADNYVGIISAAELSGDIDVTIDLPDGAVEGDTIQVSDGINPVQNLTLNAGHISAGTVTTAFPSPGEGNTPTVTAVLIDQIGNTSAPGS